MVLFGSHLQGISSETNVRFVIGFTFIVWANTNGNSNESISNESEEVVAQRVEYSSRMDESVVRISPMMLSPSVPRKTHMSLH